MRERMWARRAWCIVFLAVVLVGCESQIVYQPPFPVPIQVSVGLQGVNIGVAPELATPIGVFSLELDTPVMHFVEEHKQTDWQVPRVLAVRVDDQVYVYALKPGVRVDFDARVDDRYYRRVALTYDPSNPDGDILLELESISTADIIRTQQANDPPSADTRPSTSAGPKVRATTRPRPTATSSPCAGSPKRLQVGERAVVCTQSGENVFFRTGPGKDYPPHNRPQRLRPGAVVTVTGAAVCDPDTGWWYWPVRTRSGYTGWMAEGGDEKDPYFLCPVP